MTAVALVGLLGICPQDWECASFEARIQKGDRFEKQFGPGLTLLLEPREYGWEIVVRDDRPQENIARLTPPLHFAPNPRVLEGWHFRNSDNSGPNDGSVNAPQEEREFLFSPEVGRSLDYPLTPAQATELPGFGRGRLVVTSMELGNLRRGERAHLERLEFEVQLSWPSSLSKDQLERIAPYFAGLRLEPQRELTTLPEIPGPEAMSEILIPGLDPRKPLIPGNFRCDPPLDVPQFRALMATAEPIAADDPIIHEFHYASWCAVRFTDHGMKYVAWLFSGGRGELYQPDGTRGMFRYTLPDERR